MNSETIQIRCDVLHGVILRVGNERLDLKGNGAVTEFPLALWQQWVQEHAGSSLLTSGQLTEMPNTEVKAPEADCPVTDAPDDETKTKPAKRAKTI